MLRIVEHELTHLAERICARPAFTVLHSGDHVESHERIRIPLPHFCNHVLVVVHCVDSRDRRVIPAVIENQFSAASFEGLQVRIDRIQCCRSFLFCSLDSSIHRERLEIPSRVFVDKICEVPVPEKRHQALAWSGTSNPESPASRSILRPRQVTGEYLVTFRVVRPGIEFLEGGDLGSAQALV